MLMKKLAAGAATAAIALSIGAVAHAQSTATQTEEVIITGHRTPPSTGGLATRIDEPKDEAIIQQQYIATQVPSANVANLINLLPGVSWSTEDPYGLQGGDLRIHGFDGAHVAFILDGAPLNDTGNYAVYPGEYMIGELIDHITVNIGGSDVDSPSASALGATINVTSKKPSDTEGGELKLSTGSYAYSRVFGEFDTGTFGPTGAKAWVAYEDVRDDNYEGRPGANTREDYSAYVYQPLKGTDFISVTGIYAEERLYPPFDVSQSEIAADGHYFLGDNYTWTPETVTPGKVDSIFNLGNKGTVGPAGSDQYYYRLDPNPVNFASIRGQSKFTLGHGLTFTFDPAFFYTLANGGSNAYLAETNKQLIGAATTSSANPHACFTKGVVSGVDLNGDGDCLDTVVVYSPSNTETYRYTINSSLLYDYDEHHHFQLAYTFDYGQHRQTGEYTNVNPATGDPANIFGGKEGYGAPILTADGQVLQKRDRRSIAELNQIS
jgi:iron complex outermembrane receptor protein